MESNKQFGEIRRGRVFPHIIAGAVEFDGEQRGFEGRLDENEIDMPVVVHGIEMLL